jgi:diaminopimelate epimerase
MTQEISFQKMHGLGNDFVVINAVNQTIKLKEDTIKHLADRHLGIGFDQLLLIEPSQDADFGCRIFNADGSEAEQCGNGVRCVARFLHEEKLCLNLSMTLATQAGILKITIHNYDAIQVCMGLPRFEPHEIPFLIEQKANVYELADVAPDQLTVLSMGNPHTILQVPSVDNYPVADMGAKISTHSAFPTGTNAGFVEVLDRKHIRLRTFERGAGETFSCGSNACAAVVAGIKNGWLDSMVTVELQYGHLVIEWQGGNTPVMMTGPATSVFKGFIRLAD